MLNQPQQQTGHVNEGSSFSVLSRVSRLLTLAFGSLGRFLRRMLPWTQRGCYEMRFLRLCH